jgi:hypothetical protein
MAEEKKRKHAGHGYKHTHITHHDDGSHSIHHEHEDGKHKDYAVADHDAMMDGMMDHTSQPNPGEQESAEANPMAGSGAAPAGAPPVAAPAQGV